jgi:L-fuculose-phosphate aldolase
MNHENSSNRTIDASMMFQAEREAICTTCRLLADKGFLAGTGGNMALRADHQHFCVTPSSIDYYKMTPDDVCVLRLNDSKQISGEQKPSVESGLHALVLKARPDCVASIHTHQPIASAYTLLSLPLKVRDAAHRKILGTTVPCAGYAPSGTSWLAGKVAKCVKPDVHGYLMRNHGIVCVGTTLDEAIERVSVLELACADYFKRELSKNSSLPTEIIDAIRQALNAAV